MHIFIYYIYNIKERKRRKTNKTVWGEGGGGGAQTRVRYLPKQQYLQLSNTAM